MERGSTDQLTSVMGRIVPLRTKKQVTIAIRSTLETAYLSDPEQRELYITNVVKRYGTDGPTNVVMGAHDVGEDFVRLMRFFTASKPKKPDLYSSIDLRALLGEDQDLLPLISVTSPVPLNYHCQFPRRSRERVLEDTSDLRALLALTTSLNVNFYHSPDDVADCCSQPFVLFPGFLACFFTLDQRGRPFMMVKTMEPRVLEELEGMVKKMFRPEHLFFLPFDVNSERWQNYVRSFVTSKRIVTAWSFPKASFMHPDDIREMLDKIPMSSERRARLLDLHIHEHTGFMSYDMRLILSRQAIRRFRQDRVLWLMDQKLKLTPKRYKAFVDLILPTEKSVPTLKIYLLDDDALTYPFSAYQQNITLTDRNAWLSRSPEAYGDENLKMHDFVTRDNLEGLEAILDEYRRSPAVTRLSGQEIRDMLLVDMPILGDYSE